MSAHKPGPDTRQTVRDVLDLGRGRFWEELPLGSTFITAARTVTETDVVNFVNAMGFTEALFQDREYLKQRTPYPKALVPAALVFGLAEGLVIQTGILAHTGIALVSVSLKVLGPTFVGDTIHVEVTTTNTRSSKTPGRGVVTTLDRVLNERNEVVVEYEPIRLVRSRED
jgi:acyl dehydratase